MLFDFTLKITFGLTGTCQSRKDAEEQVNEADFGPCEDIEVLDIIIEKDDYSACMEARYHVSVGANTLAEAKEQATHAFSEEDFGVAEELDMEFVNFTDFKEDIIEAEDFEQWATTHDAK